MKCMESFLKCKIVYRCVWKYIYSQVYKIVEVYGSEMKYIGLCGII